MTLLQKIFSLPTLLVLSVFVSEMALDLYTPALPYIAQYFHVSNDLSQMTLSVCLVGFGLGSLTHGPISDVLGRRFVLLGAFIVFLIATFACASAHSVVGLIIARFFQGYGIGAAPIITLAVIRDIYPPQTANRLMSLTGGVIALAPAIAPSIGGLLTQTYDWRSCFYILLWFGALLLIPLWIYMPETLKHSADTPSTLRSFFKSLYADTKTLICNIYFLNVVTISSLMVTCIWMYIGVAPFAFQLMGVSPLEFGFYYAITVSGYILGSFVNTCWGYRFSFESLLIFGFGIIIIFSFILLLFDIFHLEQPLLISLCVAAHSFGLAFIFPVTNTLAMKMGTKGGLTASILNGLEIFVSSTAVFSISVEDSSNFVYISLVRLLTCIAAFAIYKFSVSEHLKVLSLKD
jgi:DHA1 family bicyclomycin/chloramphenicol resistance-like MFS transporter